MPIKARFLQAEDASGGSTGNSTTVKLTAPSSTVWIFDLITIKLSAGTNTVRIYADGVIDVATVTQNPATDTDGSNQIWDTLTDVVGERAIDLASRYGRSLQTATFGTIQAKVTTNEDVAKTITLKAWVLEVS